MSTSSASSMRTRTIGRSPEMPCGHRPGAPRSFRASRLGRRPQRRIRVEDPVGEALEEVRLVGLDPEVVELDLGLRPGEGRGALEGGRLAVLVGEVEDLARATRRRRWRRSRAPWRPGASVHPAAEAEDRVEHGADRVRQRAPVDHRDGRPDRPAAAEEAGAIRLVLDDAAGLSLDRRDVGGPDRPLVARSRPAGRQQRADLGRELGLHEQVLERRVGDVGRLRRQHDLGVRRQLDLALCEPRLVSDTRRISASCSADTTIVRPVAIDPSRRENSAWSSA